MESAIITSILLGTVVGSLIGAAILLPLAKAIGKVTTAHFGNTFLVCLIATFINYLIWYLIGMDSLKMGIAGLFISNVVLLSILYISISKFIWKCEWMQALKANIIWILIYAAIMGYMLSKIS